MSGGIYHPNWRIVAATLFSVVFIIGTYLMAHGFDAPQVAQASTETEILKAIATKDTDNDGLPDWEEALYGTDPHNPDTFHLGMFDGEAVARGLIVPKAIADTPSVATSTVNGLVDPSLPPAPADGTLTAAFAKTFMTLYAAAKEQNGADLTDVQISDIVNQSISSLSASIRPAADFKKAGDLTVAGSGPDALKTFAAQAELVLLKNTTNATTSEINYFKYALVGNDQTAYAHMLSIAKAYRDSAAGLAALPVPREMAVTDLELINSLMHLSQVITDLTHADSDTLAAILALQQYPNYVEDLGTAVAAVAKTYATAGIVLPVGTPGARFVGIAANVMANQSTSTPMTKH